MSAETAAGPRGGASRGGRGGARGGAKKAGPRPARHIPWPEIFKHHLSLVEGHLKMIDMVRKHTIEGSGNHRTITDLVNRAREMLRDTKTVQANFEAPKDAWKSVPIGSASDTMYPGYSPKDHEYGKAAQEFGKSWADAQKKGIEFKTGPDGPEYQFGQAKGAKRRRLSGDKDTKTVSENGSAMPEGKTTTAPSAGDSQSAGGDPLFFVDSNPTPIAGKGLSKQTSNNPEEKEPTNKKSKKSAKGNEPADHAEESVLEEPVIEFDNIDREVDARLKLKADAEKNKKDNKRKRESAASKNDDDAIVVDANATSETAAQKPPKKKSKSKKDKAAEVSSPASGESEDVEMADAPEPVVEKKTKKKGKKSAEDDIADGEHKKKKSKKSKSKE